MSLLLEASESRLYSLMRQWAAAGPMTPILGNAGDRALLEEIFAAHDPRIVFHAAAYKHVPLMEEHPLAAIANNVFATETLVQVAARHGARVVLLSTDKAVEPASVMGATKRVAEQLVLASRGTVLRLGNVLASHDSVAEVFARQIALGGPITVTDPSARRYFLTLDEAVGLLLIAAALPLGAPSFSRSSRKGWESMLLAPVLPSAHFISDLARFMAAALAPDREIAIDFTGLRPGEKESELFWPDCNPAHPASQGAMASIQTAQFSEPSLNSSLASLRATLDARDLPAALAQLRKLVPDYTPSQAVLALSRQNGACVSL
jgi:FlaA1/EpsC-like NDP-sugar epimerase